LVLQKYTFFLNAKEKN